MTYFNPLDTFYKSQIGAVCAQKEITFRVKGNFDSVVFVFKKDGESNHTYQKMEKIDDYYQTSLSFSTGLYFYYFKVDGKVIGLGDNFEGKVMRSPSYFQLTVYDKDYSVPTWLKGGVIYQIFPDRFCRGEKNKKISSDKVLHENWLDTPEFLPNSKGKIINNDFFGGDFKGIISKLSYLKNLGVTAIYLNPIFKAFSNHRYDTGDYMTIDPLLGTEKDFIELINKAEEKGIKIILDGVFNHTGDDSLYFNKYDKYDSVGAYQSKKSPYFDWYIFKDFPEEYESWWGITVLPDVNENSKSYVDFITGKNGVLEHYTKLGIGGWRLDVVDELPSAFVKKVRKAVKKINKNATVIGEVWEDASNKISYGVRREYFQGKELDSVMNYPLKNAIINFVLNSDEKNLSWVIKEQIDHYPKAVIDNLMNMLSTHDTVRLITALSGIDMTGKSKTEMSKTSIPDDQLVNAKNKVKMASLLQFTLCGVPSIYYGEEIGMQGYVDPLNRKCYPWGNEDKELLDWYTFLGGLRKDYSVFAEGEYQEVFAENGAIGFIRKNDDAQIFIAVNAGNDYFDFEFDGKLYNLISKEFYEKSYRLKPNDFVVFIKK